MKLGHTYIILVNWNGYKDTIECLESLLRLDHSDFYVIIVDNGSTDGSVKFLEKWATDTPLEISKKSPVWSTSHRERKHDVTFRSLPIAALLEKHPSDCRINLISAGRNLGFAMANNLAMQYASTDLNAQYYWILNNDTVVSPNSLTELLAYAAINQRASMIGSKLLYYHQPKLIQSLGGWFDPKRALAGHIGFGMPANSTITESEIAVDLAYVLGASIFVRRTLYDRIGGMAEDYFLYYEELDWAKRMPKDCCLGVCLDAIVYHKEGGSIGTSSLSRPSDTSLYYSYASALRFFWKFERRYVVVAGLRIFYNLLGKFKVKDFCAFKVTFEAFYDVITKRARTGLYGSPEFKSSHKARKEK